jgi:hypothetical protein
MDRRQLGGGIARETEHPTKCEPIVRRENVGGFHQIDRLILTMVAGIEHRIEIVDRREIGRPHVVLGGRVAGRHDGHLGLRPEIVKRDDPDDGRCERGRNPGIAHVGNVVDPFDRELMDFGVEGRADLTCRPGKIDHHSVGVDVIDGKAVLDKPTGEGLDIRGCRTEAGADLADAQPFVEVRRGPIVELIDQRPERLLLCFGAAQLQQHVVDGEAVGHPAAIGGGIRLRARIAGECRQIGRIDRLRDEARRWRLRSDRRRCGDHRERADRRRNARPEPASADHRNRLPARRGSASSDRSPTGATRERGFTMSSWSNDDCSRRTDQACHTDCRQARRRRRGLLGRRVHPTEDCARCYLN